MKQLHDDLLYDTDKSKNLLKGGIAGSQDFDAGFYWFGRTEGGRLWGWATWWSSGSPQDYRWAFGEDQVKRLMADRGLLNDLDKVLGESAVPKPA